MKNVNNHADTDAHCHNTRNTLASWNIVVSRQIEKLIHDKRKNEEEGHLQGSKSNFSFVNDIIIFWRFVAPFFHSPPFFPLCLTDCEFCANICYWYQYTDICSVWKKRFQNDLRSLYVLDDHVYNFFLTEIVTNRLRNNFSGKNNNKGS